MKHFFKSIPMKMSHIDFWIFFAATFFLFLFAFAEAAVLLLDGALPKSAVLRLCLLVVICALYYLGGRLYSMRTHDVKCLPRLMILFFILYLYMILNLTLFDKGMGRSTLVWNADGDARAYYLSRFVNLRPFRSIYEVYILGFARGYVNAYYMLLNLLGNVCAFMPFSLFLPLFWSAQRKWYIFFPTMLLSVAAVELLQFVFMVGSCDIDDLILNVGGALLLYFPLRIPSVWRMCTRLAGMENEKQPTKA